MRSIVIATSMAPANSRSNARSNAVDWVSTCRYGVAKRTSFLTRGERSVRSRQDQNAHAESVTALTWPIELQVVS